MLRFGPFFLDPRSRELRRQGKVVPLRPKSFALLLHLATHAGRVVPKDELLDAVWPDVAVSDAVLKVGVRELREALGDDTATPRYIETAHRVGYRFLATVETPGVPARRTSFVGRETELAALGELLAGHRLLTLTGAGGSGKTRLAIEVARAAAPGFDDGVWWVDLSPLSSPELVAGAVAAAIGVREPSHRSTTEALVGVLRVRRALLALDNCEHVVSACTGLVTPLLEGCPGLTLLATSREPLGVEGERVWPVPPLGLGHAGSGEAALPESVRLFAERAAAADPSFALAEETRPLVLQICRRLDGMPLAIELAAARTRLLSLEEIAARLDDCFQLLGGGNRDVPRHQTLRTAVDWSHELLTPEERLLFRRLAVFGGGFTLEAAERICGLDPLDSGSILDLLGRLVDKSLVAHFGGSPARYRLLEIIRQYATAKLVASGEDEGLRHEHSAFYRNLAVKTATAINGPDRPTTLALLEADLGNFRAALRHALDAGDRSGAGGLASALVWFWFHRGYWSEGRRWLDEVLRPSRRSERTPEIATARFGAGLIAWTQGDYEVARDQLGRSVEDWRQLGKGSGLGQALQFLAATRLATGDAVEARALAEDAVAIFHELGDDPFGLACSASTLGIVTMVLGDDEASLASLEEAAATARELGDPWILALPLRNLGILASRRGDTVRGAKLVRESVEVIRDLGERWFLSRSFETLGGMLARQGLLETAARLYGVGETLREEIGATVLSFYREDYERGLETLRSGLAPEDLERLWQEGRALSLDEAVVLALSGPFPS